MTKKTPINFFTNYLEKYESDTFSAEGSKLTCKEAQKLAEFFIARDFYKMIYNNIDGSQISEVLEWLRGGELEKEDFEIKE